MGFGLGGGFGWDFSDEGLERGPRRPSPYAEPCDDPWVPSSGFNAGGFAAVGGSLGPLNMGYGGRGGRYFDGTGHSYHEDGKSSSVNPFAGEKTFSLGASIGFQVSGWGL